MYTKEEIRERVKEIAEGMDEKNMTIERLKASILVDRGRMEELKDIHNMLVEAEAEAEKQPTKKRVKK